ncbi:hypothetical protein AOA80_05535 [Methanomassiliicoccales archaeon RumEn M1]|nr:hypothetical protein AOA80_05535 [Methanomassiliicoccales archaeon RumEn M1]
MRSDGTVYLRYLVISAVPVAPLASAPFSLPTTMLRRFTTSDRKPSTSWAGEHVTTVPRSFSRCPSVPAVRPSCFSSESSAAFMFISLDMPPHSTSTPSNSSMNDGGR